MKKISVAILLIVGITSISLNLFPSEVLSLEGTFSDDNIKLSINFESDYQMEVDENNKMNTWSYHDIYFDLTALKENLLGEESYVIYKDKKHVFEGLKTNNTLFYKKLKRIYIKNKKEFSNFTCQLVYTIKFKSGKTKTIRKTISVSSKSREGKLTIQEIRK